jgi:hypothetical protein
MANLVGDLSFYRWVAAGIGVFCIAVTMRLRRKYKLLR